MPTVQQQTALFTVIESAEASTSRPKFADSSDEDEQDAPDASETAGIRRQGQGMRSANLGGNVGTWEKHTKGIGAKLLLKVSIVLITLAGKGITTSLLLSTSLQVKLYPRCLKMWSNFETD